MALRYWRPGGTGNWNSTTNWSATQTGATGASVPAVGVAGDDVFFTSDSGSLTATINVGSLGCKSLNLTGFGGTLVITNALQVWGNLTIGSGIINGQITGTGSINIYANSTLDILSGFKIPNLGIIISVAATPVTITLVRDTTVTNFSTGYSTTGILVFSINRTSAGNGDNLFIEGNFTHTYSTNLSGTATLNFTTSGTATINNSVTGFTVINVVFNSTGSYTGTLYKRTGTIVRTAGNVTGLNLYIFSCAITSNGATWGSITSPASASNSITTNDDLICGNGSFSQPNSYGVTWIHNSGSVVRMRGTAASITGTNLSIIFDGTQNCSFTALAYTVNSTIVFNPNVGCQLSINSLGNTANFPISSANITYLDSNGGPVPTVSGILQMAGNLTLSTSPSVSNFIKWAAVSLGIGATTITLPTDFHTTGTLTVFTSTTINTSNGSKFYIGGSSGGVANALTGTATIVFYYTGTWNSIVTVANNLLISPNTGETYTITALTKTGAASTITYTSGGGTINANSGTLIINASITISTSNISWGNISITSGLTITINQLLTIVSNLTLNGATTFAGTFGWDCNNLICSTAGTFNITLQQVVIYRTRTGVSITGGTFALRPTMTSSGASNAIWTLDFGATQSLIYVNGTRIDSSGGQTVWSFGVSAANISTTINWNPGVPLRTVAYTFVN